MRDPLLPCGGTEGLYPSRYTSGPGVGQQHLRHARTPRIGGEGWKRRRSMPSSPASTRKAERLTTALVTYGCIFVEGRGHPRVPRGRSQRRAWHRAQGCEWTSALPPKLPQRPHELTEDRDNPLTARAVRRPGCRPQRRAFKGRPTRVDIDRRCTPPRGLAQKEHGAVHLSQVWVTKLRNGGMVQPEHALAWSTPTRPSSPG